MRRISLVGPAGSGKTTTALLIQRMAPGSVVLSIARPLREIEQYIRLQMGSVQPGLTQAQDDLLLQALRDLIHDRQPEFLEQKFLSTLGEIEPRRLIINDDCRRALQSTLAEHGFRFIWIEGSHLANRDDESKAALTRNPHDEIIPRERCSDAIDNTRDLVHLIHQIAALLGRLEATR